MALPGWQELGKIELLQLQTDEMTGVGGYDTDLLHSVRSLRLTPDGVFGLLDGAWVVDRHHRHHPAARHWRSEHVLSFGFTSHYEHMWSIFRTTSLGIGGENVIIGTERMVTLDAIAGGLRIETNGGPVDFSAPAVAEPCVEFTRFMTSLPDATALEVKPSREKLKQGVRGFVVGVTGPEAVDIRPGDLVLARPE